MKIRLLAFARRRRTSWEAGGAERRAAIVHRLGEVPAGEASVASPGLIEGAALGPDQAGYNDREDPERRQQT